MRFHRIAQTISLGLFALLLILASYPYPEGLPTDLFLRLDPSIAAGTSLAARELPLAFLPALAALVACLLVGRIFCGYICPMGATLDCIEAAMRHPKTRTWRDRGRAARSVSHRTKYVFLLVMMGAALGGVSLVFLGSPLSLTTRLYGLVIHPVLVLAGEQALALGAPLSRFFPDLAYLSLPTRTFATNVFVALLFLSVAALGIWQPRFWCRNLCPAGALFAIASRKPLVRRGVNDACNECGKCMRQCPTGAIGENPRHTNHSECIACMRCQEICPKDAISFSFAASDPKVEPVFDLSRRGILWSFFSGLFAAGLLRTNIAQQRSGSRERPLRDSELIRPPGALPEADFLARCVRCGECMKACPTNTLQPLWLQAGLEGIFSPVMVPRLAACGINCNVCGQVCPTGAIRSLSLVEKNYAKVGTAWIERRHCLVWEQDKKCLVCDEVCPYNAVSFRPVPERKNAAPFVIAHRCTGCGWCESKCPVEGAAAIRVSVIGEVRLSEGSYVEKAKEYGFVFRTKDNSVDSLAPGTFDE
ncbi:MAG: 4Fe-4S binding protein [Desulfomonilaceae bacterium]